MSETHDPLNGTVVEITPPGRTSPTGAVAFIRGRVFIYPCPVGSLLVFYHGIEMVRHKLGRKPVMLVNWEQVKAHCSDCMAPDLLAAVDAKVAEWTRKAREDVGELGST